MPHLFPQSWFLLTITFEQTFISDRLDSWESYYFNFLSFLCYTLQIKEEVRLLLFRI